MHGIPSWPRSGRRLAAVLLLIVALPATAQVSSQGHGQLTLMLGQGSAPAGGIATDVVDQTRGAPESTLKHLGFRIVGGYQFADFVSAEAGVTHLGPFRGRAAYLGTDQVLAETSLAAVEADLVGRLPFAPNFRLDLVLGAVAARLETQISTVNGSPLPLAQRTQVDAHHFGATVGADLEWRLSEHISLIAGYHAYPGVGSSRLVGSANGTLTLTAAGVHFEF